MLASEKDLAAVDPQTEETALDRCGFVFAKLELERCA
jgi:hypothetical protein